MAVVKGKKLVSVSEEVLDQAGRVSREEGISLGKLVENSLLQIVKINKLGRRSDEILDFFDVLETNRVLGGLFIPTGVLDFMIKKCSGKEAVQLQVLWSESGQWTGKYLGEKFSSPVEEFGRFLRLSRWDLNEVDVKLVGENVRVRCVSTVMSLESTNLLGKFIEGVMQGMGYSVVRSDCLKGIIIFEFKKQKTPQLM